MQQTNGVAVLATQLATTDRRALSEAWFSALHLAEPHGRSAIHRPRSNAVTHAERHARTEAHANGGERSTGAPRGAATPGSRLRTGMAESVERRAPRSELAKRIERGLTRPAQRAHGSFSVKVGDGRIHIVVRGDGARTRVIAVCAPLLRERVDRALAQARFALATRGIRSEAA